MNNPDQLYIVWSNWPVDCDLQSIITTLLNEKLVACINQLAPVTSYYEWEGRQECSQEIPLLMKTTAARYPALQARILALHPYELPEILAVSATDRLPLYHEWVENSVMPTGAQTSQEN